MSDNPALFAIYIVYKSDKDLYPEYALPIHAYVSLRQAMRHIRQDVQPEFTEVIPDMLWRAEGYMIQRLAVSNTWHDDIEVIGASSKPDSA